MDSYVAISLYLFFNLFYVFECFACLYVHAPCAHLVLMEVRERSPGTGVTDGCELPRGCFLTAGMGCPASLSSCCLVSPSYPHIISQDKHPFCFGRSFEKTN